MKTLEGQLAAYGRQRAETQDPVTTDELIGRAARHNPLVSSGLGPDIHQAPAPPTAGSERPRRPFSRLAGWQAGVVMAAVTLLGFGLINVLTGSPGPSRNEVTPLGPSNDVADAAPEIETVEKHSINVGGTTISFDLPTSWDTQDDFSFTKDVLEVQPGAEAVIYFATFPGGTDVVPCPDLPFGQLPANADIDAMVSSVVMGPRAIMNYDTVGGLRSRFVEIAAEEGAGCDPGYLYSWTPRSGGASWTETHDGDTVDAWFVDVDGTNLVVVVETRGLTVRRNLAREIFTIAGSIRFPSTVPPATADYIIDIDTGEATLLPLAIRSQAPAQYALSPDGSRVAYVAPDSDGIFQVFIAGIDGTDIQQITHPPNEAGSPAWSPDGSSVAYVQSEALFVLDVATGESRQLDSLPVLGGIQFTPDRSSILYTSAEGDLFYLWTVPVDGGTSTLYMGLEQGIGAAGRGSISPDGSMLTFLGNRIDGPGAIRFMVSTDGSQPPQEGPPGAEECGGVNPAGTWSPDGTRIVCNIDNDVRVVDVVTGEISFVTEGKSAQWLDDHTLLVEAWGQ